MARTQRIEGGKFHSNAKALRKQLRRLNSRRRSGLPGTDRRRRFRAREPRKVKISGWKKKAPHKPVPIAALKAMQLEAQNEPRKLIRNELKRLGARRRRTKENDMAIQKSSAAVWKALESQIRRASSRDASQAAQKAAKRGQQAFDDLSKAIGAPIIKKMKQRSARKKVY